MTNLQSVGFLACRLMAVYFLVKYLEILTGIPALFIYGGGRDVMFAPPLLWSAVLIAVILFLWFGAGFLSKKLVPEKNITVTQSSSPIASFLPTIVAFTGLLIIVTTLPDLLTYFAKQVNTDWKISLTSGLASIVFMIIGIILIKFKKSIARLLTL